VRHSHLYISLRSDCLHRRHECLRVSRAGRQAIVLAARRL
jgi:hypothetical protein